MRAVVQRVSQANVTVDGEVVGALDMSADEHGLVVLVGVTHDDTADDAAKLADKIWRLRILPGPDRELSAADVGAPILVISQFTLYANTARADARRGTPPPPDRSPEPLVDAVVDALRSFRATVATGRFGAHMHVSLVNDGPVTLILDTDPR